MSSRLLPSDIEINKDIVTRVLVEQFQLKVDSCRLLGEGWDNEVYLVNESLVFRFPRRFEAVELIEREIAVLSALDQKLPLKVPKPRYIGVPGPIFSRPFYGHQMLEGTSGCSVQLSEKQYTSAACALAQFLRTLHGLPSDQLSLGQKTKTDRSDQSRMMTHFFPWLEEVEKNFALSEHKKKMLTIVNDAMGFKDEADPLVLIHGDLYHRHLLFDDEKQLVGVIDWGDSGLGHRVVDLGILYQFFPATVHGAFWREYGEIKNEAKQYARFLGLYFSIALLWYGHDRQDKALIRTSLWSIKNI